MSQFYPEPAVGALIFNTKGEIFLMASPIWKGKYVLPGGHVELGETLEKALMREIKEETNLDIFDIKFLTFLELIYGEDFKEKKHFIFFDYTCKTNDKNVMLNEESTEYIWVKPSEALKRPLVASVETIIKLYLAHSK